MILTLSDVARHLNLAQPRRGAARRSLPPLILMTDAQRSRDPLADARRLPRGAAVILRHYELGPHERLVLARRLRAATRTRGVRLLIADDAALALKVRADGVHFSERALRRAGVRLRRQPRWLITAAAHSAPALRRAAAAGADAALLSPVFPTASHPGAPALGAARFARLTRGAALAVIALGGVNGATVRRLRGAGAAGIAAIGGLAGKAPGRAAMTALD